MRYRLAPVADLELYELVLTDGAWIEWFLLERDEASALGRLIAQVDPKLESLAFAGVCGLVRAVTGRPPEIERGW
jgi:hypothetical protein